jgi:hypothetical protein
MEHSSYEARKNFSALYGNGCFITIDTEFHSPLIPDMRHLNPAYTLNPHMFKI